MAIGLTARVPVCVLPRLSGEAACRSGRIWPPPGRAAGTRPCASRPCAGGALPEALPAALPEALQRRQEAARRRARKARAKRKTGSALYLLGVPALASKSLDEQAEEQGRRKGQEAKAALAEPLRRAEGRHDGNGSVLPEDGAEAGKLPELGAKDAGAEEAGGSPPPAARPRPPPPGPWPLSPSPLCTSERRAARTGGGEKGGDGRRAAKDLVGRSVEDGAAPFEGSERQGQTGTGGGELAQNWLRTGSELTLPCVGLTWRSIVLPDVPRPGHRAVVLIPRPGLPRSLRPETRFGRRAPRVVEAVK